MMYISNAFSIQMLKDNSVVTFTQVTAEEVSAMMAGTDWISAIGHQDTAAVMSSILGISVPMNRINVSLSAGDTLIVGQLTGGRLPEGATSMPEGMSINFWKVSF